MQVGALRGLLRPLCSPHVRAHRLLHRGGALGRTQVVARAEIKESSILRSLSELGEVAVLVVDGTAMVAEAVRRHKTAPTASAAFGRTLLGTLILAAFRKEDEALQVTFKGDGPIGSVMAIADTRGNVKGKVDNPDADPPLNSNGKLDVARAVGKGILAVVRSHPLEPNPYTGIVPIVCGEIAEDLANYLVDSEQTNSALGLGVAIDKDCGCSAAGGFLIQVLPFCSEDTLMQLEKNLSRLPSITQLLQAGRSQEEITDLLLAGIGAGPNKESLAVRYGPCDEGPLRERMARAVASLGLSEAEDIMKTEGKIEVKCDFCNQQYELGLDEVRRYIAS